MDVTQIVVQHRMNRMAGTTTSSYWYWLLCVTLLAAKQSRSNTKVVCGKRALNFPSLHQKDFDLSNADVISPALMG